jgi:hypothetical protein
MQFASLYKLRNASKAMSIDPKDLWATLPSVLRRQIVDDVGAVLAEVSREVGTGQAVPSGAQGCRLHPAVDTPPGGEQSGTCGCNTRCASAQANSVGMRPTST